MSITMSRFDDCILLSMRCEMFEYSEHHTLDLARYKLRIRYYGMSSGSVQYAVGCSPVSSALIIRCCAHIQLVIQYKKTRPLDRLRFNHSGKQKLRVLEFLLFDRNQLYPTLTPKLDQEQSRLKQAGIFS